VRSLSYRVRVDSGGSNLYGRGVSVGVRVGRVTIVRSYVLYVLRIVGEYNRQV